MVSDARETRAFEVTDASGEKRTESRRRALGAALVPGAHLKSVEAAVPDLEAAAAPPVAPEEELDLTIDARR